MANTIKIKSSGLTGNVPASLEYGELAINYADGKIFYKNSSNAITELSTGGTGSSITVSDTPPSSPSAGDLWYESDTGKTFIRYDSFWVEIGGDGGPAGESGSTPSLGYQSGQYYSAFFTSATSLTTVEDNTYFVPIYISETVSLDRIACYTNSGFSGTATVRLGMYNNDSANALPSTVLFDAGTVSCTASSTLYAITINQTVNAGWYWLAFNSQTNASTNLFTSSTTFLNMMNMTLGTTFGAAVTVRESGITGAFGTVGSVTRITNSPMIGIRIA